MTITLYGQYYVASAKDAIGTLFSGGKTANGLYKLKQDGVYFFRLCGTLAAFLPRRQYMGPVSATQEGRRTRYMFALCSLDEQWMTVPPSFMAATEEARALIRSLAPAFDALVTTEARP